MKQAKATVEEAETLLRWLQGQDTVDRQPPPYNRTIFGYLLMLEHCADPAKDYIDFKPGTSPDEIEALKQRAEAAEARVRELEAQYACKRHNGEEAPEAAAQLTDDMLRSCQICGLTVDISKGHCEPTIEFTMQGRTDKKTKKLAELEAQNARLREALEPTLCRAYTVGWQCGHNATVDGEFFHVHHLDEPTYFLEDVRGIMKDSLPELKAALADGKAAP